MDMTRKGMQNLLAIESREGKERKKKEKMPEMMHPELPSSKTIYASVIPLPI